MRSLRSKLFNGHYEKQNPLKHRAHWNAPTESFILPPWLKYQVDSIKVRHLRRAQHSKAEKKAELRSFVQPKWTQICSSIATPSMWLVLSLFISFISLWNVRIYANRYNYLAKSRFWLSFFCAAWVLFSRPKTEMPDWICISNPYIASLVVAKSSSRTNAFGKNTQNSLETPHVFFFVKKHFKWNTKSGQVQPNWTYTSFSGLQ